MLWFTWLTTHTHTPRTHTRRFGERLGKSLNHLGWRGNRLWCVHQCATKAASPHKKKKKKMKKMPTKKKNRVLFLSLSPKSRNSNGPPYGRVDMMAVTVTVEPHFLHPVFPRVVRVLVRYDVQHGERTTETMRRVEREIRLSINIPCAYVAKAKEKWTVNWPVALVGRALNRLAARMTQAQRMHIHHSYFLAAGWLAALCLVLFSL